MVFLITKVSLLIMPIFVIDHWVLCFLTADSLLYYDPFGGDSVPILEALTKFDHMKKMELSSSYFKPE